MLLTARKQGGRSAKCLSHNYRSNILTSFQSGLFSLQTRRPLWCCQVAVGAPLHTLLACLLTAPCQQLQVSAESNTEASRAPGLFVWEREKEVFSKRWQTDTLWWLTYLSFLLSSCSFCLTPWPFSFKKYFLQDCHIGICVENNVVVF